MADVLDPAQVDAEYLKIYERCKKEAFADRWIFERQMTKCLHYVNLRQWLGKYSQSAGWLTPETTKNIPRPITSKPKEAVQAIRAMFTSVNLGVDLLPTSRRASAVVTAKTGNDLAPIYHELHDMDAVNMEGDFWFIVTGNVIYHTYYDPDAEYIAIPYEQCSQCKQTYTSDQIAEAKQRCPGCGAPSAGNFAPLTDPQTQQPAVEWKAQGRGATIPLSLLEVAFPLQRPRWKDVDFLIKLGWRTKRYCEEHPALAPLVPKLNFHKSASERSLQIFKSLPFQTDVPAMSNTSMPAGESSDEEGIEEYELWQKPTPAHQEGLVLRVLGDRDPIVLHLEESEGIPGPLPYKDKQGRPLWTFAHAAYEHVGGRVVGTGAVDPALPAIDRLNRLDSLVEMIMTTMAVPVYKKPKGQEIAFFGDSSIRPAIILDYGIAPGGGSPEVLGGVGPDRSFEIRRQQYVDEIDQAFGTSDIFKGMTQQGITAYSAMQFADEKAKSRFTGALVSRAKAYRDCIRFQMEIDRQFGPTSRIESVMTPARSYAFKTYMDADLSSDVRFEVSTAATMPTTALAIRAAVEHLNQLRGLDMRDPDTSYAVFQKFGLEDLMPAADSQHQFAMRNQEAFERWLSEGTGKKIAGQIDPTTQQPVDPSLIDPKYPLKFKPWYDAPIHRLELIKWAIDDHTVDLLNAFPEGESFVAMYLAQLEQEVATRSQPPAPAMKVSLGLKGEDLPDPQVRDAFEKATGEPPLPPPPSATGNGNGVGAGLAMKNSNQNSAPVGNTPQPAVPAMM